jgi:osmotically-inducible protein OsmY
MSNPLKMGIVIAGLAVGFPLVACAQTATQESTGNYVDDASITTKVKTAIFADPSLKVFEIHVDTIHNVVRLTGHVDSEAMIGRATEVSQKIAGVASVQNDLVVR